MVVSEERHTSTERERGVLIQDGQRGEVAFEHPSCFLLGSLGGADDCGARALCQPLSLIHFVELLGDRGRAGEGMGWWVAAPASHFLLQGILPGTV